MNHRLLIALASAGALLLLFVVGFAGQVTILLLPAFCLWTPAMMYLGYQLRSAKVKVRNPITIAVDDESFT